MEGRELSENYRSGEEKKASRNSTVRVFLSEECGHDLDERAQSLSQGHSIESAKNTVYEYYTEVMALLPVEVYGIRLNAAQMTYVRVVLAEACELYLGKDNSHVGRRVDRQKVLVVATYLASLAAIQRN